MNTILLHIKKILNKGLSRLVTYSIFAVFLFYRAYYVGYESKVSGFSFQEVFWMVLQSDAYVVIFILSLDILSSLLKKYYINIFLKSVILLVLCAYAVDVLVFKYLSNRINIDDVLTYGKEVPVIFEMIKTVITTKFGILSLLLVMLLIVNAPVFVFAAPDLIGDESVKSGPKKIFIILGLIVVSYVSAVSSNVNNNGGLIRVKTGNLFYAVFSSSYKNNYSNDFIKKYEKIKPIIEATKICVTGRSENRNVILVIVESLSSYQSLLLSNIFDYTPGLDAIAENNVYFKNFHANGFTTVGGYMALLNGLLPIPKTSNVHTSARGGWVALTGYERNPFSSSLPSIFNENGYKTIFLANSDLSFAGAYNWLKAIGFNEVEDASSEVYLGQPRFLFNAPSDSALFDYALSKVKKEKDKYLLVLSSISTHRPYIDVTTGRATTEKISFRQLDKTLSAFVSKLQDVDYFENGILIITGDHRAMRPPISKEAELYGEASADRIPLIIIDNESNLPRIVSDHFQQVDLFESLKAFASSGQVCRVKLFGEFFNSSAGPSPPSCIFFSRGDNRNIVTVKCDNKTADIILDGDNTRLLNGAMPNEQSILELINALRISVSSD